MTLLEYYWHLRGQERFYDYDLGAGYRAIIYNLESLLDIPESLKYYED